MIEQILNSINMGSFLLGWIFCTLIRGVLNLFFEETTDQRADKIIERMKQEKIIINLEDKK